MSVNLLNIVYTIMNYRHIYHAGNFADVFKHVVLIALLESLLRKDKPYCYLETHAGVGRYNLTTKEALKTKEFVSGIKQILKTDKRLPLEVQTYLDIIKKLNPENPLHYYPGSPLIAYNFLRADDRMVLAELHPEDASTLKQEFFGNKNVAVHQTDGYQTLKAFLPPKENRGLVFIDPPYEDSKEIERMGQALQNAIKHWRNGMYAIWYPIKEKRLIFNLKEQLKKLPVQEILLADLSIHPEDSAFGLNGSGMAIINPPWQLDARLNELLPWLWQVLSPEKAGKFQVSLLY